MTSETTNLKNKLALCLDRKSFDGCTSLCGNHSLRFTNDFLTDIVDSLQNSMMMASIGISEMNATDMFTLAILASHYKHVTGKELSEDS